MLSHDIRGHGDLGLGPEKGSQAYIIRKKQRQASCLEKTWQDAGKKMQGTWLTAHNNS